MEMLWWIPIIVLATAFRFLVKGDVLGLKQFFNTLAMSLSALASLFIILTAIASMILAIKILPMWITQIIALSLAGVMFGSAISDLLSQKHR